MESSRVTSSPVQLVASVQFEPLLLKPRQNVATAQQMAFEAALKGASLIVLPELCTSGYVLNNVREAADCAQTKDGWQTRALAEISRQKNCHIVFGCVELHEGKLYNSAIVVGPNGLECSTFKHNLAGSDNLWAQPGTSMPPVVLTKAGRTGVLICRDVMNKYRESYEFYRPEQKFYKKGDVDTIALLTNWGSGYSYPDTSWVELVESTNANVIVSNRVGDERDMTFKGGSCVISKDRKIWTHGSNFDSNAIVGGIVLL